MCKKLIYLVCGVLVLITVAGVPAGAADEPITVVNYSFEEPNAGKQGCWDGEASGSTDVPGWTDGSAVSTSSGVESAADRGFFPSQGNWTGFLRNTDPNVYNLTNHIIGIGDVLELKLDGRSNNNEGTTATLRMALYYDVNGTRVTAAYRNVVLPALRDQPMLADVNLSFTASSVPSSYNHRIGIEFENIAGYSWIGMDNVRLTLKSPIYRAINPDPAYGATVATTNVTLSWRAGDTAVNHRVYFGTDFDDVKNGTEDTNKGLTGGSATYPLTGLEPGQTYYWRIDEVGSLYTGVVWKFTVSAKIASDPSPPDGTKLVDPNVTLSWTAGLGAINRDVYFGTDPCSLPLVSDNQTATTYDPSPSGILNYNTTYYWCVDEYDGTTTYPGDVWSFNDHP